ncbi:MAG: M23 family metallopeptidase [Rhodovibrionaceae bacterium]|nr:M23 family metallopeptidase [Rhodovibrionaceae bacterium]
MTSAIPLHVIRNAALAIGVVAISAVAAITTVKSSINTGGIVDEASHRAANDSEGPAARAAPQPEVPVQPEPKRQATIATGPLHALDDLESQLPAENFIFAPGSGAEAWLTDAPRHQVVSVSRGDTLMQLLTGAGLARSDAYYAIEALKEVFSPRHLRPGQEIELTTARGAEGGERLLWLNLAPDVERDVVVLPAAGENRFAAQSIERPLAAELVGAEATIHTSLFEAAADAGVPPPVLVEMIRTFSFDVDFQRDVQPGDTFKLVYKRFQDENGDIAKTGEILYAQLTLSGRDYGLYRFVDKDGFEDYYAAEGKSVRKALMRTPIDGARLSSGFGKRRHPVLGYTKMHKGTDFAAPTGTPIYAAGNGTVARASRYGGYGNYVRIRHNSTYQTAYAHMHGYAKGIRAGARVKQGQVIGYVGSTGRSTGPHLHYEVLVNGKQVNPRSIKLPSGKALAGEEMFRFQHERARVDALRERLLGTPTRVACAQEAC